jgi:predicted deacylase
MAPYTREASVIPPLCEPGDLIEKGQPIAEVRDIYGRPIGEKVLYSEYDGWVIARSHGVIYYPGQEVYGLAIRDELPTVQPYPKDYFK